MNGLDANLIIANAPDPVFVSDLQGKILQANDAVYTLLGFRKDEVLEQSLSRFISIEETREFMAALREVGARGVTRNARLNPRSASGEIIPTTLNASALRDPDGTVIGAIGILRDMRAYEIVVRDLEESRRRLDDANRAKDEFLATLSHELRTPLTAILGWVRLLRSGTLDPASAHRGPEIIERNTRVLAQLIEELLDVSRIITGKLRLDVRSVNLVSVVVAAMEAVQAAADAKGILLATNLDPYLGPVSADPDRLQQVVWNLLTNAIKFTPTGGRVDIRLERADSLARITVSDTGKGIRSDLLPFVFDRFRQEETSIGRRHGGLGLGLAIVRHIVELHGGVARAESPGENRGATFTVDLPLAADAGGGQREIDREGRPAILPRAFGTRDAAVEFDDVPHDGEPESEAAMSTADRRLLLPEAVEHEWEEVRSNPLASIAHRDSRHRVGPLQPDVHPAAAWRELDGVGQEVPD